MLNSFPKQWLFPDSILEAHLMQKEMAKKVFLKDAFETPIQNLGGVDLSNNPFDPEKRVFGAIATLAYPSLETIEAATRVDHQEFPYISGLLGFREAPTLVQLYDQLTIRPNILLVDGHGISHPRGLGIASHLGILLDIPTIGVAKSILVGKPLYPLAEAVGSQAPLIYKGQEIGMLLRSKKGCNPLIISAGHKITLSTSLTIVRSCIKKYRLPEPTRLAHVAANDCRRQFLNRYN